VESESPPYISEDDARFWDLLIRGAGIFATIGGFVAAILTLNNQHAQLVQQQKQLSEQIKKDTEDRLEQYKRSFWQKQLELYAEASRVTSLLATGNPTGADWITARARFEQLYWGELSIVESPEVEQKMIEFRGKLKDFENLPEFEALRQIPSNQPDAIAYQVQIMEGYRAGLRRASFDLAHLVSLSVGKAWKP
jgi:hypothetical protein